MPRLLGSIVAGFLLWTVLFLGANSLLSIAFADSFRPDGSTDSVGMHALILLLSIAFSIASGWLTSRMARVRASAATWALGILLFAVGLFVQLQYWDLMPLWYHLAFLAALIPGVLVGDRLARRL